jgi:hypothetical protein
VWSKGFYLEAPTPQKKKKKKKVGETSDVEHQLDHQQETRVGLVSQGIGCEATRFAGDPSQKR